MSVAECGFDEPHEAHEFVVAGPGGGPLDLPCPGLPSLDAAWSEAEAALPEGWAIDALYRVIARTSLDYEWEAVAHESDWQGAEDSHASRGPTPAAALRALAEKLRSGVR